MGLAPPNLLVAGNLGERSQADMPAAPPHGPGVLLLPAPASGS